MSSGKYDDIINLPAYKSPYRNHMSNNDRAAQFLPFAALSGYDAAIIETARLTAEKKQLSTEKLSEINAKLDYLQKRLSNRHQILLTYFVDDSKKDGGEYISKLATIERIDSLARVVTLDSKESIRMDHIYGLEGECFDFLY